MATTAAADNVYVIEVCRHPACRRVAVVTRIAGVQVRWSLAGGRNSIMTGPASSDDLRVIDCKHRYEYVCRMTVLADVGGLDVGNILADGLRAVVATDTVTADIYVVEIRR